MWNESKEFWITACNMHPECGLLIASDFDKMVNAFTFYNCSNETGRYPAYYKD